MPWARLGMRQPVTAALLLLALLLLGASLHPGHAVKTSHIVDAAPEASLENDVDDVSTVGACAAYIPTSSCKNITAGEGRLAECISGAVEAKEAGSTAAEEAAVPADCQEEVYQYFISRNVNINKNVPLARACKEDVTKMCNGSSLALFGEQEVNIIVCLKESRDAVSTGCQKEVFKLIKEASLDYRADPAMRAHCDSDVKKYCADVPHGGGHVQECLQQHYIKLSWDCTEELVRLQSETDSDIRLTFKLFVKCLPDKKKFCAEVAPGHAMAKECLEDHRGDPGFSPECREELEHMIERRARDFRIDSRLKRVCEEDILGMCGMFGEMDGLDGEESSTTRCLQDYMDEISNPQCRDMVQRYKQLAAEDVRFDVPLADACSSDRQLLCGNIAPGSARVIRCLQNQRNKLSATCRATLFDEEVRFSENIDFQYPMKTRCLRELDMFCKDVPHGSARAIRCLQDNKDEKDFGDECRVEVKRYEQKAASDYRLNYRLHSTCINDVRELCQDVRDSCDVMDNGDICGGRVLRCLSTKMDDIQSPSCRKEVFYFQKMEVSDYNNDVILAAACRADVDLLCKNVQPGEGRIHACLRANSNRLSQQCRSEELLLEQAEAENIELRPSLMRACSDERTMFCREVSTGSARVFRCLAEKMGDADFSEECRVEIVKKLKRRQANWKLDPPLRKACKADVGDLCAEYAAQNAENGTVYACLLRNVDDLDPGCRRELGRAYHMALYIWSPGALMTNACDTDVASICLKQRPNMDRTPGAVGTCLAAALEKIAAAAAAGDAARKALPDKSGAEEVPSLSDGCRALADVAEPPDMKAAFDTSLTFALVQSQLSSLEGSTGLTMLNRGKNGQAVGISLTGWTAILGIAAMVLLVAAGVVLAYRRYTGSPQAAGYTLVLKKGAR